MEAHGQLGVALAQKLTGLLPDAVAQKVTDRFAIDRLDADVTSIEAARSKMEVLADIAAQGYPRGIGPGVYDIHSPRVPSEAEVAALLGKAVGSVPADQLWINPDCGLKTRRYEEVTPALEHIVAAARTVRATLTA